ncbi:hypothetical protein PENTCL1PPCAC_12424 [Pristionchus entomophagus]|uniref:Uncharacterized protein n=1 Tax=Pristionchus entomophagus TaxID=358040 RepID=A0AAV5TC16_9BILA|nr:hypothetical protein PENTCL1PPCAC_12424 [Pristionchus entomophagus]
MDSPQFQVLARHEQETRCIITAKGTIFYWTRPNLFINWINEVFIFHRGNKVRATFPESYSFVTNFSVYGESLYIVAEVTVKGLEGTIKDEFKIIKIALRETSNDVVELQLTELRKIPDDSKFSSSQPFLMNVDPERIYVHRFDNPTTGDEMKGLQIDEHLGSYGVFIQWIVHRNRLFLIKKAESSSGIECYLNREIGIITIDLDCSNSIDIHACDENDFIYIIHRPSASLHAINPVNGVTNSLKLKFSCEATYDPNSARIMFPSPRYAHIVNISNGILIMTRCNPTTDFDYGPSELCALRLPPSLLKAEVEIPASPVLSIHHLLANSSHSHTEIRNDDSSNADQLKENESATKLNDENENLRRALDGMQIAMDNLVEKHRAILDLIGTRTDASSPT